MRIASLDCFAGISGDMFLGALLDAGVPLHVLEHAVAALGLGASLRVETVDRSGISATKVHVFEGEWLAEATHAGEHSHAHPHEHPHKHEQDAGADDAHAHEHQHTGEQHDHPHAHPHSPEHSHPHSHPEPDQNAHLDAHNHPSAHAHDHPHTHGRSLTQIRELIRTAPLAPPVRDFAIRAFELLGASEARIHNVPVDDIHFHEVGAVDAIVDIVAASAGVHHLTEQGGPLRWYCSAINVGGGMVLCAHGTFPVPAPATADLLRGMPTYSAHVQKELVTPTGAALLAALAPDFAPQPAARTEAIGYGAGTRNPEGFPNVLRLNIGVAAAAAAVHIAGPSQPEGLARTEGEAVLVLETAIDDATPQLLAYVAERALEAHALDVMLTPVIMKKGRPGTLLTLLANPADGAALEQLLLRETTTLGVRKRTEHRSCLDRQHTVVDTPYGAIRVKVGSRGEERLNATPEYEDCRAAAGKHRVPFKQVQQAAMAAFGPQPVPETETAR